MANDPASADTPLHDIGTEAAGDEASTVNLDLASVRAFLTEQLGDRIADLEAVGHGEWSKAFTFVVRRRPEGDSDQHYVVRFSVHEDDFLKDRAAMAFASAALPIPRVVEIGRAFDAYYYALAERAFGTFLDDVDNDGFARVLPSLLSALDAAREVDLSQTTGYGMWRHDGVGPHATWKEAILAMAREVPISRIRGWRKALEESPTGAGPFDAAFSVFERLVPACPEDRHLIHADLLNYNVLVAGDRVSAVIDWGNSMYGDFLFDIAWLTFWQPWYTRWSAVDIRGAARRHYASIGLDVPDFEARMRCYELIIGMDGMAYQAFKGRWSELAWTANRTTTLV